MYSLEKKSIYFRSNSETEINSHVLSHPQEVVSLNCGTILGKLKYL